MRYRYLTSLIVLLSSFFLQQSVSAQCPECPYWAKRNYHEGVDFKDCDVKSVLPILCDLAILDSMALTTKGYSSNITYWERTDFDLFCGVPRHNYVFKAWTSFIASTDSASIEFRPRDGGFYTFSGNCLPTPGNTIAIFDITEEELCSGLIPVAGSCDCIEDGDTLFLNFPTIPGHQYMININSCGGCDTITTDIFVHYGAGEVMANLPDAVISEATMFSTPDSICRGATGVPFSLLPTDIQNPSYNLYIDNIFMGEYNSQPFLTDWNVPPGNYEVCVEAFNYCHTADLVCTTITVADFPDQQFTDTICTTDLPYFFMGQNINAGGEHRIEQVNTEGCLYDAVLQLTVEPIPPEMLIDTFVCFAEPVIYLGETYYGNGNHPFSLPSSYGGCDTLGTLHISYLDATISFDPVTCFGSNGYYAAVNVQTYPLSGGTLAYEWYHSSGLLIDTGNPVVLEDAGNYYVVLTFSYAGAVCTFTSDDLIIDAAEFLPAEADLSAVADTICSGSTIWWEIPPAEHTLSYQWTAPPEVHILKGSDSTAVQFSSSTPGSYDICITTINDCGQSSACHTLYVLDAPLLSAGNDTTLCGLEADLRALGSPGFWSQSSGPARASFADSTLQETSISVPQIGMYSFVFTASPALCPVSDTVTLTFVDTLSVLSIHYECLQSQDFVATVEIQGGVPPYSILQGGGSMDSTIYTSASTVSGDTVFLVLTDSIGCAPLSLVLTRECDCLSDAGTMASDTLQTCDSADCLSAIVLDEPILKPGDIVGYALHQASGNSLQNVFALQSDSTFCFLPGMQYDQVYYISRIVGLDDGSGNIDLNDPCLSVAPGQAVLWLAPPTADILTQPFTACKPAFSLQGQANGTPAWTLISGPEIASFGTPDEESTTVQLTAPGNYCFSLTATVSNCSAADTLCVEVLAPLSVQDLEFECNSNNSAYTVSFVIQGGEPGVYSVSGDAGTLTGAHFMSEPIPAGSAYSFVLENPCDTLLLEGTHSCDCFSDAGTMSVDTVSICGSGYITVQETQNPQLDSDDILLYALHTGNPLNPLATSTSPSFSLLPTMQLNTIYFIAALVGIDDGTGNIDADDACRAQSNSTPVIWYDFPEIHLSAMPDTLSCTVTSSLLSVDNPLPSYTYSWTSVPPGLPVASPTAAQTEVAQKGVYRLIVTDTHTSCADTVTIEVYQDDSLPIAEAYAEGILNCVDTLVRIDGTASSQGVQYSYQWSPTSGMTDTETLQPTVSESGIYTLTVHDLENGCTASTSVEVEIDTIAPLAIATVDARFQCDTKTVTIDATASSVGTEFVYQWSPTAGMTGAETLQPTVSEPGVYTLLVTNTENGCTAQVSVTVEQDTSAIQSADILTTDPFCIGENSGQILIEAVHGGTAPYQYSLGQQQNSTGIFTGLAAGTYALEIRDAHGCAYFVDEILLAEPDALQAGLTPTIQIAIGQTATLIPVILPPTRAIGSLVWTTETGEIIPCSPCDSLFVSPDQTTTYFLTVTDINGCVASASVTVIVINNRNIYIPNAFTPNGDGVNDTWTVYTEEGKARIVQLEIYNKWGDRVFQASDIPTSADGWDGTFRGEKLNPGTFSYRFVLEFTDGYIVRQSGTLTLIR